jgi:LysM repeat protein
VILWGETSPFHSNDIFRAAMSYSRSGWSGQGFRFLVAILVAVVIVPALFPATRAAAGCVGTAHIVQPGERLDGIARQYNVPMHAILYHGLPADPAQIAAGQVLCVGHAPAEIPAQPPVPAWSSRSVFLTMTRSTGGELAVAADSGPVASSTRPVGVPVRCYEARYTVQPGDSIYRIAARFGVSAQALLVRNRLPSATICVGQLLVIPIPRGC